MSSARIRSIVAASFRSTAAWYSVSRAATDFSSSAAFPRDVAGVVIAIPAPIKTRAPASADRVRFIASSSRTAGSLTKPPSESAGRYEKTASPWRRKRPRAKAERLFREGRTVPVPASVRVRAEGGELLLLAGIEERHDLPTDLRPQQRPVSLRLGQRLGRVADRAFVDRRGER